MNTKFYQVDLLQKYRQSISKRYRGGNRVYQLNNNRSTQQSISESQQKIKHYKTGKNCLSDHETNQGVMIIRSTNAQISFKAFNSQTEINNKKFTKIKVLNSVQKDDQIGHMLSKRLQGSNSPEDFSPIIKKIKNTDFSHFQLDQDEQKIILNKVKFRKRTFKDINKMLYPDQSQESTQSRYQPFAPIIKGQKKPACMPPLSQLKSKTHQNQPISRLQANSSQPQQQIHYSTIERIERLKKNSSHLVQKQQQDVSSYKTLSNSTQTDGIKYIQKSTNLQKKIQKNIKTSSKVKSKEKRNQSKLSFPTIKEKESFPKVQKHHKVPLLLKFKFDLKHITSQSYIIMQAESQKVLWSHRSNKPYQIASLTKIMTFYVVLKIAEQNSIPLSEEMFTIPKKCQNVGGTSAQIYHGETYSIEHLLYGLMLPSGNDVALSLSIWGGKYLTTQQLQNDQYTKLFISEMNRTAAYLQLQQTRFGNPHGLPHQDSRSSAYDVARLCSICMQIQIFRKVVSTKIFRGHAKTKQGHKRANQWENTHKLLRRDGFVGIKTGITITAGPCLATAYKFRGKTYICIILRAIKVSRRFKETRKLLNWCLNKLYLDQLAPDEVKVLKKLKKNNAQLDSDYSEDEHEFRYDKNNSKQFRKRCDIISQM